MRLYLAQHGSAKPESEDVARPLTDNGRRQAECVAAFLDRSERPRPARIAHSGKLRAQQTAEAFSAVWGGIPVEAALGLAPNDDPATWSSHLASVQEDLMLVGHLPYLQRLTGLLLCGDPDQDVVRFRNACILCLERSDSGWSVLWHFHPALLSGG